MSRVTKFNLKTMNWYLKVLKSYGDFSGRSRRQEYWMFFLFNVIFAVCAMILDNILGTTLDPLPYGAVYLLYALVMFVPGLAVTVRRLHDTDKSGWMVLVGIIPFVGGIWLLVLLCMEGTQGENGYGEDPKNPSGWNNSDMIDQIKV
jgi:uncharacterized membrane protein YhaH (DUF805 family)